MKPIDKLIKMIPQMTAVEFAGLARVLNVKLIAKNPDATTDEDRFITRDFADVLDDVLKEFNKLNRVAKRNVLNIVKASNHEKVEEAEENAGNS